MLHLCTEVIDNKGKDTEEKNSMIPRDRDISVKDAFGFVINGFFGGFRIAEFDELHAGHKGLEGLEIFFAAGGGKRADGFAVIRADGAYDFATAGARFSELERGFNRFGAAVADETVLKTFGRNLRELFGKIAKRFAKECFSAKRKFIELVSYGSNHFRMAMAERERAIATEAIEIFLAFVVVDVATFAIHFHTEASEREQLGEIGIHVTAVFGDDFLVKGFRIS